jgi:GT2 family glycosyltransferase
MSSNEPIVTILIPHYKTLELTKLCLRLLRKQTDESKVRVIVIDNGSNDTSSDYLKTVKWVDLIVRQPAADVKPARAHSDALDEALAETTTPYVLSIHTDTFVKSPQWLHFLLAEIEADKKIAGVGSWKLEEKPLYKRLAKKFERCWQLAWYKIIGKKDHQIVGVGDNYHYLRSHCAMYRTDLLKKFNLSFSEDDAVAGKGIHKKLVEHGYQMKFLPSETLIKYLCHVNHATMALNPELGARKKTVATGLERIQKTLHSLDAENILKRDELDA